jgi:hypothetical protein
MDMCAAPGSKTAQIIEMVHASDQHKVVPGTYYFQYVLDKWQRMFQDSSHLTILFTSLFECFDSLDSAANPYIQLDWFSPTMRTTDAATC